MDEAVTAAAAGRRGGEARKRPPGHAGYSELGRRGGQRVRELVAAALRAQAGARPAAPANAHPAGAAPAPHPDEPTPRP